MSDSDNLPINGSVTQDGFEEEQAKLDGYRQKNIDLLKELQRYGQGVDSAMAQGVMFQTFLDTFLSPEDRLALEINFEYRMSILLREAVSDVRRRQLMVGVPSANNSLGK